MYLKSDKWKHRRHKARYVTHVLQNRYEFIKNAQSTNGESDEEKCVKMNIFFILYSLSLTFLLPWNTKGETFGGSFPYSYNRS